MSVIVPSSIIGLVGFVVVLVGGLEATPKPCFEEFGGTLIYPVFWGILAAVVGIVSLSLGVEVFELGSRVKVTWSKLLLAVLLEVLVCAVTLLLGVNLITKCLHSS